MSEPRTAAGRRLHARIFGLSDRMPDGAELDNLILAIEAEAADHPPYPTPDEFAGMTHEQFVAFLDRIGARRFTQPSTSRCGTVRRRKTFSHTARTSAHSPSQQTSPSQESRNE